MTSVPLPSTLQHLNPIAVRARQLRGHDDVASYWCFYYILSSALSEGTDDGPTRNYLANLMDDVEKAKTKLAHKPTITDESVASAYMYTFALQIFATADKQDRAGNMSLETAKSFKAAADFLDVYISLFVKDKDTKQKGKQQQEQDDNDNNKDVVMLDDDDDVNDNNKDKDQDLDLQEGEEEEDIEAQHAQDARTKTKYAKWRTTQIVKAIKSGNKPSPPPSDPLPLDEDNQDNQDLVGSASSSTSLPRQDQQQDEQDNADIQRSMIPPSVPVPSPRPTPTAGIDSTNDITSPSSSTSLPSVPSAPPQSQPPQPQGYPSINPPSSAPLNHRQSNDVPTTNGNGNETTQPPPPTTWTTARQDPDEEDDSIPLASDYFASLAVQSSAEEGNDQDTQAPLDPTIVSNAQKFARWAISALNYDDLDTASEQLARATELVTQMKQLRHQQ